MSGRSRRKPYTERGIRRVPCRRCGSPSRFQWQVCADGNIFRGLCEKCDVALNHLVLHWMRDPDADQKVAAYARQRGMAPPAESDA